MKQIARMHK